MSGVSLVRTIVLWGILGSAVWTDVRAYKIPNRLILCGVCVGVLTAVLEGPGAVAQSLICGPVMLGIGFLFWKLHVWKAGDAKLLWVVGHFYTLDRLPLLFACIMIAGGACAFLLLCRRRLLKERLTKIVCYFQWCFLSRQYQPYQPEDEGNAGMPFAVAVFFGELISWMAQYLRVG